MEPKLFVATKALIIREGKILILRESAKYEDGTNTAKFDVPGGRLTPGEHFSDALMREVREETGLTVSIGKPMAVGEWRPQVRGEQWQIVGIFFECMAGEGEVALGEDHDAYEWITPSNFAAYPLIENLRPVFEAYLNSQVAHG